MIEISLRWLNRGWIGSRGDGSRKVKELQPTKEKTRAGTKAAGGLKKRGRNGERLKK